MYLAIITLPLLGSIVSGFFGRKVGVSGAQLITSTSVIVTTLLAIVTFFEVGLNNTPVSINLFRWIDSESLDVLSAFHFDSLTVSMLIPVLTVSSLVHIYSIGYMSHDPHNQRFFSYLSLFTFMMIILITANNFLLMFVGWEGVGICSYLLVSFWFTRIAANQSSISAFLTNRVGDCFLTLGIFTILWSFGNIDYSTVFSLAPFVNENIVTIIGICLLIGAMAKSSQVGLHVWLPMAMEGPTPVSALIHAATMVTAGVYLLMRTSPLIEYSSTVLILCLWLGAITTVFSSLVGLFQQDIKKVIAYSTMSQLGMMVIAVGLSSYNIALFHLVNHAFYKGLLFLGAGAVIHAVADNQDFRKYGGLRPFLPLTYSVMLIASLSLVAFPFMTGFYSKDFILESAYGEFYFSGTVVYFIATIGAMFTTLYSVKVLYLTFLTNPLGPVVNYKHAQEGDIFMSLPLIILAVFSIFFGYITKDIFIGLGSAFFTDNSLFIHPNHEIMLDTEFAVPSLFKLLPLAFTISLSVLALFFSELCGKVLIAFKFTRLGYNIFGFFNQRLLVEMFYNKYVTELVFKLGGQTSKVLDKGSVELLGPYGLEKGLINLSRNIISLDIGVVTSYALYILIGLIFYLLIPYLYLTDTHLLLLILLSLFTLKRNLEDKNILIPLSSLESRMGLVLIKYIMSKFTLYKFFLALLTIVTVTLIKCYLITLNYADLLSSLYGSLITIWLFFKLFFNFVDLNYFKLYLGNSTDGLKVKKSVLNKHRGVLMCNISDSVNAEGSSAPGNPVPASSGSDNFQDNSATENVSEVDYYQRELIMAKDALKALNKDKTNLTETERFAKEAFEDIDEFNKKDLEAHIASNTNNLKKAITNSAKANANSHDDSLTSMKRAGGNRTEDDFSNKYTKNMFIFGLGSSSFSSYIKRGLAFVKSIILNYTLSKFLAALLTIILVASIKYYFTGNLHLNYDNILGNIWAGLLGWTLNTGLVGLFSDCYGLNRFNLGQIFFDRGKLKMGGEYIDYKPVAKLYISCDANKPLENTIDKGSNSPSSPTGSHWSIDSEIYYWKDQLQTSKDALSSLGKSDASLTNNEIYAKAEMSRLGYYNKDKLLSLIAQYERNVSFPLKDSEAVRLEISRNNLMRNMEIEGQKSLKIAKDLEENQRLETEAFEEKKILEAKSALSSLIPKLEANIEYNRIRRLQIPVAHPDNGSSKLTFDEERLLANVINSDPHAPLSVKNKINQTRISNANNAMVNYLKDVNRK